jgi:hypothetical protein
MAVYKISPLYKKSAVERTFYFKDGRCIIREEGYRWGSYSGEFDERPDIDLTDDIDMVGMEGWEFDMLDDGCWLDWEFPDDMDEDEREEFLDAYDENWNEGLEELGWISDDYECIFQAPLLLECEDTDERWTGDDDEENLDIDLDDGVSAINEQVQMAVDASWPFPTKKAVLDTPAEWPFPMSRPVDGNQESADASDESSSGDTSESSDS